MERVAIVWAPLDRGAGMDARTTQSPENHGASLNSAGGGQIHRLTPLAMRTLRPKSSRFCHLHAVTRRRIPGWRRVRSFWAKMRDHKVGSEAPSTGFHIIDRIQMRTLCAFAPIHFAALVRPTGALRDWRNLAGVPALGASGLTAVFSIVLLVTGSGTLRAALRASAAAVVPGCAFF
jgi:hypothetical protein